jgi:hypothetical protein
VTSVVDVKANAHKEGQDGAEHSSPERGSNHVAHGPTLFIRLDVLERGTLASDKLEVTAKLLGPK